eukprot:g20172.t1
MHAGVHYQRTITPPVIKASNGNEVAKDYKEWDKYDSQLGPRQNRVRYHDLQGACEAGSVASNMLLSAHAEINPATDDEYGYVIDEFWGLLGTAQQQKRCKKSSRKELAAVRWPHATSSKLSEQTTHFRAEYRSAFTQAYSDGGVRYSLKSRGGATEAEVDRLVERVLPAEVLRHLRVSGHDLADDAASYSIHDVLAALESIETGLEAEEQAQGQGTTGTTPAATATPGNPSPSGVLPGFVSVELCRNFQKGKCRFGDKCKFSHAGAPVQAKATATQPSPTPAANTQPTPAPAAAAASAGGKKNICRDFVKGKCTRGKSCKFLHETVQAAPATASPAFQQGFHQQPMPGFYNNPSYVGFPSTLPSVSTDQTYHPGLSCMILDDPDGGEWLREVDDLGGFLQARAALADPSVSQTKLVRFYVDNCSAKILVNDLSLVAINNHKEHRFATSSNGVASSFSTHNNGELVLSFPGCDGIRITDAIFRPNGPNLLSSHVLAERFGIYDRTAEGYFLRGDQMFPVERRNGHATILLSCRIQAGGLDPVFAPEQQPSCLAVGGDEQLCIFSASADVQGSALEELEHRRQGHVGHLDGCETCFMKNHVHKPTNHETESDAENIGDEVLADFVGPTVPAVTGVIFLLILLDLATRIKMSFCAKTRCANTVVAAIRMWVRRYSPIRRWKTDGAREFLCLPVIRELGSGKFNTAPPYEHTWQALIEITVRNIVRTARAMLYDAGLGAHFWNFAVVYATYLANRQRHRTLGASPWQRWKGRAPDLRNIRVFGCLCFILLPKELQMKTHRMTGWSTRGRFVGVDEDSNTFLVWGDDGKLHHGRQVRFLEQQQTTVRDPLVFQSFAELETGKADALVASRSTAFANIPSASLAAATRGLRNPFTDIDPDYDPYAGVTYLPPEEYTLMSAATTQATEIDRAEPRWQKAIDKEFHTVWVLHGGLRPATDLDFKQHNLAYKRPPISTAVLLKEKKRTVGDGLPVEKARFVGHGNQVKSKVTQKLGSTASATAWRLTLSKLIQLPGAGKLNADGSGAYFLAPYRGPHGEPPPVLRLCPDFARRAGCEFAVPTKALPGLQFSGYSWELYRNEALAKHGWIRTPLDYGVFSYGANRDPDTEPGSVATAFYRDKNSDFSRDAVLTTCVDDFDFSGFNLDARFDELQNALCLRKDTPITVGDWVGYTFVNVRVWIHQAAGRLLIDQGPYLAEIAKRFGAGYPCATPGMPPCDTLTNATPEAETYRKEAVGSVNYANTISVPEIANSVRVASSLPGCDETTARAKKILRYLRNDRVLEYKRRTPADASLLTREERQYVQNHAASDADHAGCKFTRRSVSGGAHFHSGNLVAWSSKKQPLIASSPGEAETISQCFAMREQRAIKNLDATIHLGPAANEICTIDTDSQTAIGLAAAPTPTANSKSTKEIEADGFTKDLEKDGFDKFKRSLGVIPRPPELKKYADKH